ncbi:isoamyl alcohol oxidase [Pyrenophora seminiperda CCB06]|uniref:Isoamyl alcohol oxidase n=1 Tax=Pyrenophora seminiperda CCB06 TaxID=1302712 RepID=A0A3M7M9S0_9PLEO|nr:isoamyl alcohol oxidase [Pyrenophora seminiperda CCB06]
MTSSEWHPLLNEKIASVDGLDVNNERLGHTGTTRARSLGSPFRKVILLPLFGAIALYSSYKLCARYISDRATWPMMALENSASLNYTCTPGKPCWPSTDEWDAFNQSVSGHLKLTVPWAAPCYSDPSSDQCQDVAKNYGDGVSRTKQYGSMEFLDWESLYPALGCNTRYENIGEIGAGIQAQEAWEAFEPLGMLVTVGAVASVGIAGGFGQGGGHGPLGPKYGLMVDQAVEFDVVTADGKKRTINECSDPDLFWAMRGGGGGSYAVLTSYKFQLHPAVPINVYSFQAHFPAPENITESKIHRDILTGLATSQPYFGENGVAGFNFVLPDHVVFLEVMPSTDIEAIKNVTADFHDLLTHMPGLEITENEYHSFEKFSQWHEFTERPSIARNGPVGLGFNGAGRFIPRDLFTTPDKIDQLVSAVVTAMQFSNSNNGGGGAQLYATGPDNNPDNGKTSVNPIWRDSLWEIVMGQFWMTETSHEMRAQIQKTVSATIEPLKALTPGGGCYLNEGDWTEENWQETFFGTQYDKLLAIKQRYDPTGLFNCWKCVGWTGYDDPKYSCYAHTLEDLQPRA